MSGSNVRAYCKNVSSQPEISPLLHHRKKTEKKTIEIIIAIHGYVGWLIQHSGNGIGHINKVKLRRARLVLGLVTTFGGSTIPEFIQAHSA